MNVDVADSSSSQHEVQYAEPIVYEEECFDVIDAGVVSSSSQEPVYIEQSSWSRGILPSRRKKSELFRAPESELPYDDEVVVEDQDYLEETDRAVCSVRQSGEEEARTATKYLPSQTGQLVCHSSTSTKPATESRNGPLQKLSFQIGRKILHFKVIDAVATEPFSSVQDLSGRFRCLGCRLMFKDIEELEKHNKISFVHHSAEKRYFCVVCGTAFSNRASLTIHHKIHSNTDCKTHECSICHKTFSRASNLLKHVKMHQAGKHFCEICGRCFKDIDTMVEHQTACSAMMNGDFVQLEKPLRYQCGYCNKLFHHKRDKFIHERVHTGEKPYSCGYCGRGFSQSQALTIHIRNHTGERPFSCSYCSKQFKDSSSLRKHEFSDHIQVDFMDFEEAGKIAEETTGSSIWKLL